MEGTSRVEPDFRRTFPCQYCGEVLPLKDLASHVAAAHPEVVAAGKHWAKDANLEWIRFLIPAVVVWALTFALSGYSGGPNVLVLLDVVVGFFLVVFGTYALARYLTRTDMEKVKELPHFCRICGQAFPGFYLKTHMRQAHPSEARLQEATRGYALLSGAIVTAGMAFLVAWTLPYSEASNAAGYGRLMAGIGFLSWTGLVWAWLRLVYAPRFLRAREQWMAGHPS